MVVNAQSKTLKLAQYESRAVVNVTEFEPGTYQFPVQMDGNGLRSTLFVSTVAAGASVAARYWDYSTGLELGEENEIGVHPPISTPITSNRIFISGSTGKLFLEITVTGGTAAAGVYVSVLESVVTDVGQADDGETPDGDSRGIVVAGYDEVEDKFYWLRTNKGVIQTEPAPYPKFAFGELTAGSLGIFSDIPGAVIELVPGKTYRDFQGLYTCGQPTDFILLFINGSTEMVLAHVVTAFGQYNVQMALASVSITAGLVGVQRVQVRARNNELPSLLSATICCVEER